MKVFFPFTIGHLPFALLLSALLPFCLSAQSFKNIEPTYEIEHIDLNTSEDAGLFVDMIQDNDGYLWITGSKGVVIFDGHQGVLYSAGNEKFPLPVNSGAIGSYQIRKDRDGIIYTDHERSENIIAIDPGSRSAVRQYSPAKHIAVPRWHIQVSESGDVFTVHRRQEADSVTIWKVHETDSLPEFIFSFAESGYGQALSYALFEERHWIQTTRGILRIAMDGKASSFYPCHEENSNNWVAQHDGENYYFFEGKSDTIRYWNASLDTPEFLAVVPHHWRETCNQFCVHDHTLFFVGGAWLFALDLLNKTTQDLSSRFVGLKLARVPGTMAEDIHKMMVVDGVPYILGSKNLYRIIPQSPHVSAYTEEIAHERGILSMRGLTEDGNGNVYASDYSGVSIKQPGRKQFERYLPITDIAKEIQSAYSLNCWNDLLLWNTTSINFRSGEIKSLGGNVFRGHVTHLLSGDTLWMYIWYTDKFYVYDLRTGKADSVRIESGLDNNPSFPHIVNDLVEDKDRSGIWMATRSDGIMLLDKQGKIIRSYPHAKLGADPDEGICDLYLDGDTLWYGCLNGLGMLNIRTEENHIYSNPVINSNGYLKNRTIFSFLPDEKDGLYLGTNYGLAYFDCRQKQFYNLDENHPLARSEYNRASAFRDSRGRYYFGTTNGLFSFLPEELDFAPASDSLRALKLYGISVFNGSAKEYRYLSAGLNTLTQLDLKPSDTNIQFSFSVPEHQKTVYYRYRVAGLDEQWSAFSPDNRILLYALPPGEYTLEVDASSDMTDAHAASYALGISMPEVWYRKVWVILLIALTGAGIVVAMIRYRFQQKWLRQKALEKLRVHISSDLHDDVGSILSGVAMQSQMMSYDVDEKHKAPMLELSSMSREAMERMRDTVWAIDARKDKYENLVERMRDFAEKTLERKNITHEFVVKDIDRKKFINPEVRQNIYLIFKEAITNVVKHSDGKHVRIELAQDAKGLQLVVHDNGTLQALSNSDGLGISNIQMRARRIGGTCEMNYEGGYKVKLNA